MEAHAGPSKTSSATNAPGAGTWGPGTRGQPAPPAPTAACSRLRPRLSLPLTPRSSRASALPAPGSGLGPRQPRPGAAGGHLSATSSRRKDRLLLASVSPGLSDAFPGARGAPTAGPPYPASEAQQTRHGPLLLPGVSQSPAMLLGPPLPALHLLAPASICKELPGPSKDIHLHTPLSCSRTSRDALLPTSSIRNASV